MGDEDDDAPEVQGLPPGVSRYITPDGLARLRAELRQLMREERPRVVEMTSGAR